uniref:Uncharacterized protein n=1 Tax=Oryza brachyantha TaxID=4533 RepID=J3MI84_ORYBR
HLRAVLPLLLVAGNNKKLPFSDISACGKGTGSIDHSCLLVPRKICQASSLVARADCSNHKLFRKRIAVTRIICLSLASISARLEQSTMAD